MRPVYIRKIRLRAEHVDMNRRLRPTELMRLFQQCCIAHTEELGMGRAMTLDRGLLWVVVSERIVISRMPEYDEEITLECTPGQTLHFFFPRNLVVRDASGEAIVRAKAMWALIDAKSRQMADPSEKGIVIDGSDETEDLAPVMSIRVPELTDTIGCTATYSMADINGHMNNAAYLSIALDDMCRRGISVCGAHEIAMTFRKEIPFGSSFSVSCGDAECRGRRCRFYDCPEFSIKITV